MLPLRSFVVYGKIGGHCSALTMAARWPGSSLPCRASSRVAAVSAQSHAGVLPAWRNAGIGRRLKLRQREEALERGIELIEWTFDPLELKNAFFNLERLGAVVRQYSENQYGVTDSPLHGGLPYRPLPSPNGGSVSPRVRAVLAGETVARRVEERIAYPPYCADSQPRAWRGARDPENQREKFHRAFERGLAVTGFERSETEGTYLLEPWSLKVERITLRQICMPLIDFFETSFRRTTERHIILVEAQGEGVSGWGEVTAGENPFYNEEWTASAWMILRDLRGAARGRPRTRWRRGRVPADGAHSRP